MPLTTDQMTYLNAYSQSVFGQQDEHLQQLMPRAIEAGLPDIAVSADVGRLLMILTSMTAGRCAVEVGTLGGYSGIWIARGLKPGGRLITIEPEPTHAAFALEQFDIAGASDRVELRQGTGLAVLPRLANELGNASVDVVFLDAIKSEYAEYFSIVRPMIAPGGLLLADNVYGTDWSIDDEDHPTRNAVDRFNRKVADDPDFETVAVPIRSGVMIARRSNGIS